MNPTFEYLHGVAKLQEGTAQFIHVFLWVLAMTLCAAVYSYLRDRSDP